MSNAIDPRGWVRNFGIIADLLLNGVKQPTSQIINIAGDINGSFDPATGILTIVIGAPAIYSGADGMVNADFAVVETSGKTRVGSNTAFTADHTLTLPAAPTKGQEIEWSDEATTAGGSLLAHNLIINGNGKNVQYQNTAAATYTVKLSDWSAGMTITLVYNGTFWKVKS